MLSNPYISVVMSVYNEEKYVSAAIKSILNQTYPYFEFIIINDGSTDKSEEVIKSFKDERILYRKVTKVNFSKALNIGLETAKYELIARMDADDISLPDRFEKQINFLKRNPDVQVISSGYALFKENNVSHIYNLPVADAAIKEQLNYSSAVCHAGSIYYKNHILKYNGYDEKFDILEDIDLWLRIRKDTIFHNIEEPLYLIRIKESSMTSNEAAKPKSFYRNIYLKNFDRSYYKDDAKINQDYAVLLYKFSSVSDFKKFIKENKIISSPKIFLLYLWSFLPRPLSSKNIVDWLKWKIIEIKTLFNNDKNKYQNLIKDLSR